MIATPAQFPVGIEDFRDLVDHDGVFVDKTLLIRDVLDTYAKVALFPRPRRWGKTLNMTMLRYFFAPDVHGTPTKGLFDELLISQIDQGAYLKQQGQYPVIFVSFKNLVQPDYASFIKAFQKLIVNLYQEFELPLLKSKKIATYAKKEFERVLSEESSTQALEFSLKFLSKLLATHYGQRVVVLIDEYDQPINHAYLYGYDEDILLFMRNLFGNVFKTNEYLERGAMTGILRIAKAGLFSGLNNVVEYDLFEEKNAEHFGFTEPEVTNLLEQAGHTVELEHIKQWYNGYQIGNHLIFNPWSIMNCLSRGGKLGAYWVQVSDNKLLKDKLRASLPRIKEKFSQLLQGQPISVTVDRYMSLDALRQDPTAFWTLLLHTGYLTPARIESVGGLRVRCDLRAPNAEIKLLYSELISSWFETALSEEDGYQVFIKSLIVGDVEAFRTHLTTFLQQSFSYHDTGGEHAEQAYHTFMLGLVAGLYQQYIIKSNRESGTGRFDLIMLPKDPDGVGILFEFKRLDKDVKEKALTRGANEALKQIKQHDYVSELEMHGVKRRLYLGIAFAGKRLQLVHASELPE